MLRKTILSLLLILPSLAVSRAEEVAPERPVTKPERAVTPPMDEDKSALIKELIAILKSMSDDDYNAALKQAPQQENAKPQVASREAALKSAYTTMAALEYKKAAKDSKDEAPAKAYQRVIKEDAEAVAVDPETMQNTGQLLDVLKWLGNASLNYWLNGGQVYVGRQLGSSKTAKLEGSLNKLDGELAGKEISPEKKSDLHYKMGAAYEELAAAAIGAESAADKAARKEIQIRQLAELLQSMSDDDYRKALSQLPKEQAAKPEIASKAKVLQSAYATMAALEYRQAALSKGDSADRASQAYQRVLKEDAEAVAVNPETMQESGQLVDVLKWMANASLNYWLNGGTTYVGREMPTSKTAKLHRQVNGLDRELSAADSADKKADLHYQKGAAYEELAAASIETESGDVRLAKQKARLRRLADIVSTVSDDEFKEALKEVPSEKTRRRELASRAALLKSSYVTLAALEYKQAGDAKEVQRISDGEAEALAVNPESLQPAGWFEDLLGVASLGGIGYLIYENERHHHHRHDSLFIPQQPPPPNGNPTPDRNPPQRCAPGQSWNPSLGCVADYCQANQVWVNGRCMPQGRCYDATAPGCYCQPPAVAAPQPIDRTPAISNEPGIGYEMNCLWVDTRLPPPNCPPGSYYNNGSCTFIPRNACDPRPGHPEDCGIYQKPPQYQPDNPPSCPPGQGMVKGICRNLGEPYARGSQPRLTTCFGPGRMCLVGRQLNASVDDLQGQLAAADVGADKSAELHHRLGAVYEQLASAALGSAAPAKRREPAPESKPKPEEKPQEQEDPLKRDMNEMDSMGKDMDKEIDRRRGESGQ